MRIALWQTTPAPGIDAALAALDAAAGRAAAAGADLLITPEMYLGGYDIGAGAVLDHAGQSDRMMSELGALAQRQSLALVAGLPLPGPEKPLNACIALDAAGHEVARYAKTHLFGDVDAAQFSAGATLSRVFDFCGLRCALAICYDIEFPELARSLALAGAEVILVPTANMAPFDSVAMRLVPARAEENAIFVAYANYVGAEGRFVYNGLSCVCGPDGQDLLRGSKGNPDLLFADIDRAALGSARRVQTHLADRRTDLYGGLL